MEHTELVQELQHIEKLPLADRIKLNQKRRKLQLAAYAKWTKSDTFSNRPRPKNRQGIAFSPDIQLMDIAARGASDEMKSLLKAGVDPNLMNHDGLTALHQCCIDGTQEMVSLLLKHGADVNITDRDLWTPLHAAATCGHFKIVTTLIRAGASLTAINGDGDMPHDITEDEITLQYIQNEFAKRGITDDDLEEIRHRPCNSMITDINYVLSTGGNLNQPLDQRGTFMHVAIANGFNDIVNLLLQNKAAVSVRDDDGWQAIHVAAYWCNEEALDMLTEVTHINVNLRALTDNGETPYDLCEHPEFKMKILHKLSMMPDEVEPSEMASQESLTSFIEEMDSSAPKKDERPTGDNIYDPVIETSNVDFSFRENPCGKDPQISPPPENNDMPIAYPPSIHAIDVSSDRRNSLKEAKHRAPLKRHSSERLSNMEKKKVAKDIPEITRAYNPDLLNLFYENPPPPISSSPENSKENIFPNTGLRKISEETEKDRNESKNTSVLQDTQTYNEICTLSTTVPIAEESTNNKEDSNYDEGSKSTQPFFRKTKKMPAPPPPKGSLLDLKRQRQEIRENQIQNLQDNKARDSRSTFYHQLETFDPPPSPTMIHYRYKMVLDDKVSKKFIKNKKCTIM